jgi:hypothetical protein
MVQSQVFASAAAAKGFKETSFLRRNPIGIVRVVLSTKWELDRAPASGLNWIRIKTRPVQEKGERTVQ